MFGLLFSMPGPERGQEAAPGTNTAAPAGTARLATETGGAMSGHRSGSKSFLGRNPVGVGIVTGLTQGRLGPSRTGQVSPTLGFGTKSLRDFRD
jgi:hypothetical protein